MATAERVHTDAELVELCVSGQVRMERALDGDDRVAARAVAGELIAAMRAFCTVYLDWLVLTDDYVLEELGHEAHTRVTRPERIAELAVRTGMSLADLVAGQALVAGPENDVERDLAAAIAAGERERALELWLEAERILRDVHDLRRDAVSDLLGQIYAEYEAEGLKAAQMYAAERGWWKESIPHDFTLDPAERVREVTYMLTVGAFSDLYVSEHDDRWVVHQNVCGNCGRQVRDRYQDDEWGLRTFAEPGPMTFGKPELTIYQTHLAVIHHMYAIDLVGAPWPSFNCIGLAQNGGHCELVVYKDPAETSPEFYEMVGMSKPGS
ncbi:MAG TPA: hypothetical protein VH268_10300 [Solirubrobacterales bacterium]|jgi:hypothetical protein|nr:hypothetical protein [Solirubrobacterales bacterium]